MSYILSNQLALNGLGNTTSKKKFDIDKWAIGRMEDEINAMKKFEEFISSSSKVPHFKDVINDHALLMSIIHRQIAFVMKDESGNTHIVGYMDDEPQPHTLFTNLYNSGALFKGHDKATVDSQMVSRVRRNGNGWERDASWGLVKDRMFYNKMVEREKSGIPNPVPYLYVIKDKPHTDWENAGSAVYNSVVAIARNFLPVAGTILGTAIDALIKVGDNLVKKGKFSFDANDYMLIIGEAFVPLVGLDSTISKLSGNQQSEYLKTIQDLSKKSIELYSAIGMFQSGNQFKALENIGKTLGINSDNIIKSVIDNIKIGDIASVYDAIGMSGTVKKSIADIEKIVNQMQNSETVTNILTKWKQFELKSVVGNALQELPAQQFILDIHAGLKSNIEEIAGAIPNSPGIISNISQNVNITTDEFRDLLSIPQNLPIPNIDAFNRLTIDAMVERAKSYATANIPFVLPSNLSENMQQYLYDYIPRVVTNADVRTVTVASKFYREFP